VKKVKNKSQQNSESIVKSNPNNSFVLVSNASRTGNISTL
jgi:hypothetical protein